MGQVAYMRGTYLPLCVPWLCANPQAPPGAEEDPPWPHSLQRSSDHIKGLPTAILTEVPRYALMILWPMSANPPGEEAQVDFLRGRFFISLVMVKGCLPKQEVSRPRPYCYF